MKKTDFEYLVSLLKEKAGWEFDESKFFILDKKIYNLVREKGYDSVETLLEELKKNPKNILWQVVEALAMSDTSFNRDYEIFKSFDNYVIPKVREENRSIKKIRIWSLGCSTGQEAYSAAFVIKDKIEDLGNWNIDIVGTDISTNSIARAQKGAYTQFEVQVGLNAKDIIDNFNLLPEAFSDDSRFDKECWQVKPEIMKLVEFRRYNILDEMSFTEKFDIILCRNVLRFFDKASQSKIIERIFNHHNKDGYLYLGVGERVEGLERFYAPVQGLKCLYKARSAVSSSSKEKQPDMPTFSRPPILSSRT